MANSEAADGERWVRRPRRLDDRDVYESGGEERKRRRRVERVVSRTQRVRRRTSDVKMTTSSRAPRRSESIRSSTGHRRSHHRERSRSRRRSAEKEETTYVYGAPGEKKRSSRIVVTERRLGRDGESSEEEEERVSHSEPVKQRGGGRIIYVSATDGKVLKTEERRSSRTRESERPRHSEESIHRSRAPRSRQHSVAEAPRSPPKRSASTRDYPPSSRSSIRRSNTTSSRMGSSSNIAPSVSHTTTSTYRRSGGIFGSFFSPAAPQHIEPEKLVTCLTCLSDDIPRSKSAKLKCGHRMCQSCLKRIFKLSVNDPQHMPPKCCTADFIPLKHVDKLFNTEFKKTWNRKFAEYSTKDRIYCPARRCGEWIKPGDIHREDGKKVGKCSRCKTKVCCQCNGRWHGTKDCPKDEETNRLLETAKEAGWQRCYNCRTMVELKEGCNHMTCRCTAEFCMICGLKWKSCNCPWFNYDAVETDRLDHMQVPEDVEEDDLETEDRPPRRLRRPRPPTYHDEVDMRRRQERADEELARRLQRMALEGDDEEDYQGGIGDIHGIGNGAEHFMNQDYIRAAHNILTGNFDQATAAANYVMGVANARGVPPPPPPRRVVERYASTRRVGRPPSPPPMLRRHTMREQVYNSQARPAERVVPRRSRTDYVSEAAVHAPVAREPPRPPRPEPTPAVLAGLKGKGRATNRVSAWRNHIYPGEPEEGVISVPGDDY